MTYHSAKKSEPAPRNCYKLATVRGSHDAARFERALAERLDGSRLTFFSICHQNGTCDVTCDSGDNPLPADELRAVRAMATKIRTATQTGVRTPRRRST